MICNWIIIDFFDNYLVTYNYLIINLSHLTSHLMSHVACDQVVIVVVVVMLVLTLKSLFIIHFRFSAISESKCPVTIATVTKTSLLYIYVALSVLSKWPWETCFMDFVSNYYTVFKRYVVLKVQTLDFGRRWPFLTRLSIIEGFKKYREYWLC